MPDALLCPKIYFIKKERCNGKTQQADDEERHRLKDLKYLFPRKYCRRTPMLDAIDDIVRHLIDNDKSLADKFLDQEVMKFIVDEAKKRVAE